jgi:hypothetical protein
MSSAAVPTFSELSDAVDEASSQLKHLTNDTDVLQANRIVMALDEVSCSLADTNQILVSSRSRACSVRTEALTHKLAM